MEIEQIYQFFKNPSPAYLKPEVAVCYVLSVLLSRESYGSELSQGLEIEHPQYLLSDTVLYDVLYFLESENAITCYWKTRPGRGRPRRMFKLNPQWQQRAIELARFWQNQSYLMGEQAILQQLKVQIPAQFSPR